MGGKSLDTSSKLLIGLLLFTITYYAIGSREINPVLGIAIWVTSLGEWFLILCAIVMSFAFLRYQVGDLILTFFEKPIPASVNCGRIKEERHG